jgi:hypothetical protein
MPRLSPTFENAEYATVGRATCRDYLLDVDHDSGGPKARFLLSFGFRREQWEVLEAALLEHASRWTPVKGRKDRWCQRYDVIGELTTPDGRNPVVTSNWIVLSNTVELRFVTHLPRGKHV